MANNENFEPMQVDAAEENDNDGDVGVSFQQQIDGGAGGAIENSAGAFGGGPGGLPPTGNFQRGDIYGENSRVNYNIENPSIDLEAYAQGYTGLAAIYRLRFIAHHCPVLRVEALKLAISHVMNTHNTSLYSELHKKLVATLKDSSTSLPDVAVPAGIGNNEATAAVNDQSTLGTAASVREWIEVRTKKAALKLEKLDTDLKNYRSNSIKESIRRGHDDLGDHFLDGGDLANALKCYSRARDYCTSGRHVMSMCINVIKVSVYLQNWSHVISYVNKALATPELSEEGKLKNNDVVVVMTRLKCAGGLADLMTRKYSSAAKQFLAASLDHCDCPDLISPNNVAIYGGLTALATFDRAELLKQVISSTQFKLFLELEPQLREVIQCFYESRSENEILQL